jgi:hypothetical protein
MRTFALVAGSAWLVVAGSGGRSVVVDDGDDWQASYFVFSVALLVAAALSVMGAAWVSRGCGRPRLRAVGLVVGGVGVAASLVAWALPLWMTVLGVGLAMVSVAAASRGRRLVGLMAAGQFAGLGVLFAGIAAEVGRRDEWGDYPAAGGIALVVTAAVMMVALVGLMRLTDRHLVTLDSVDVAHRVGGVDEALSPRLG